MGSLPEQLESNHKMLEQLQLELTKNENHLMAVKDKILQLKTQKKEYLEKGDSANLPLDIPGDIIPENENIAELKAQYKALKVKYTDKHPDMIKLKKMIENLENEEPAEEAEPMNLAEDLPTDNILHAQNYLC